MVHRGNTITINNAPRLDGTWEVIDTRKFIHVETGGLSRMGNKDSRTWDIPRAMGANVNPRKFNLEMLNKVFAFRGNGVSYMASADGEQTTFRNYHIFYRYLS